MTILLAVNHVEPWDNKLTLNLEPAESKSCFATFIDAKVKYTKKESVATWRRLCYGLGLNRVQMI